MSRVRQRARPTHQPPLSLSSNTATITQTTDLDAEHPLHVPHGVEAAQYVEGRGDERVARDGQPQQRAEHGEHGHVEEHEDELLGRALALLEGGACSGLVVGVLWWGCQ